MLLCPLAAFGLRHWLHSSSLLFDRAYRMGFLSCGRRLVLGGVVIAREGA
jgi:hypothetical protein